jgi:hypothetical protein
MLEWVVSRARELRSVIAGKWVKWLLGAWALISSYDTFGAQLVPRWLADRWPPLYEAIEMTSGWLPWWAWGWIVTGLVLFAVIEYAARLRSASDPRGLRRRTVAHLRIHYDDWGDWSIRDSDNIRHMEPRTDGMVVEFKEPVPPRGLTARVAGTDAGIDLVEATKYRAKLAMTVPGKSTDILFESAG